ncbi:MAG: hypothetical protein QNK85_03365 [Crocinitomicaceae bacterium]
MNKHNMSEIMSAGLENLNISIGEDDAIPIAKSIRKPMWNWHVYVEYVSMGLYFLRMGLMIKEGVEVLFQRKRKRVNLGVMLFSMCY